MKFYNKEVVIRANELKNLRNKVNLFKAATKTKDAVVITMITTHGVIKNDNYHEIVEDNLTMDILFE